MTVNLKRIYDVRLYRVLKEGRRATYYTNHVNMLLKINVYQKQLKLNA